MKTQVTEALIQEGSIFYSGKNDSSEPTWSLALSRAWKTSSKNVFTTGFLYLRASLRNGMARRSQRLRASERSVLICLKQGEITPIVNGIKRNRQFTLLA